ncbi:uncharacterized protein JCM10292_004968 [Rhodotorula paludigena]|uniref:uncharacterized protein n=1 Tax=Rhodotorula paludigena TaxID=86838 RepID=UPI0031770929
MPAPSRNYRGPRRPRGSGAPQKSKQPAPSAPGPLHDHHFVVAAFASLGGRGQPDSRYLSDGGGKSVLANYIKALGGDPRYDANKVNVDGQDVFRVTIVADPDPPPPPQRGMYNSASGPAMPPIIEPVIGTGDAATVKEAEKLAAIHACMQLSARGLFTNSNLPTRTRGQFTPLHAASQSANASTSAYSAPSAFFDGPAAAPSSYPAPSVAQQQRGMATAAAPPLEKNDGKTVALSTGERVGLEEARAFMDFYCARYNFGRPDLQYQSVPGYGRQRGSTHWRATLRVKGAQIGMGEAHTKKEAANRAYLDTASYLEQCDPTLWDAWTERKQSKKVEKGAAAPHVVFEVPADVEDELREAVWESREGELYTRARDMVEREHEKALKAKERALMAARGIDGAAGAADAAGSSAAQSAAASGNAEFLRRKQESRAAFLAQKSQTLRSRLQAYQADATPAIVKLREQRASLPVTSHASSVLAKIATSSVVVVLAATGSGKTTQLPQLILDDAIMADEGAKCNIVCTQPRRIAAISVAERVAKERGEQIGDSVGYQVRFEAKPPRRDGSILFCTTGLFLRRMQADLDRSAGGDGAGGDAAKKQQEGESFLDGVTHVCVDEVHERDVDTDLLLFVLRRLLHERRKQGKAEIKVVLMSATIDPRLFTTYFADPNTSRIAPVVEVPGRSFPVEKHWLDETIEELRDLRLPMNQGGWVFQDKSVVPYLQRELVPSIPIDQRTGRPVGEIDDLEMPYPLLALIIAHVLTRSDEGHVLVFLPGWDEIQAVRNILQDRARYPLFDVNFNARDIEIHVLHSTIPIAEQQAVFEPPAAGIRRIVLSTNIAETSVTIPDVVFVVDSAKCKEKRYDPERRLSQLVSAWTGTSNVLQRAGRAGRHRPGEYYGIVSKARFDSMDIHQTVEMLRTDLASTAMHVTGLQLPGLSVFDVLSATIQPPEPQRVMAALETLLHVGAIDRDEKLTSLGRVLLQLPVEAAIGKLCLLGSFFRCLDQTLTLAAILTNRDPFLSPPLMKAEADRVKNSWAPQDFRGDPFAILQAYNAWWDLQGQGNYVAANNFARENFLSKPTLLLIQKIKEHLVSSLDRAGVLQISAGGQAQPQPFGGRGRFARGPVVIPPQLNENGHSLPLLSALIATAVAPNFAIRISEKSLRTSQDKSCAIHPSSVNSRKNEKAADVPITASKQLYAYGEKSKTGAMNGKGEGQTFLRSTTKLDPLGYMLFGAYALRVTDDGLECDGWLPIVAPSASGISALDDVERLKEVLDLSLLRVFEGLNVVISRGRERPGAAAARAAAQQRQQLAAREQGRGRQFDNDDEDEAEADEEAVDRSDPTLSAREVQDLDRLTSNVVHLLNSYNRSLGPASSRTSSRPQTPSAGGFAPMSTSGGRFGPGSSSAPSRNSTPYNSRPPSALGGQYYGGGGAYGGPGGGGGGGFGSGGGAGASSGSWRR